MFPERFCSGTGMRRISMGTRDELLKAVAGRYRAASRAEKGLILTEFAEIFGYHRKHVERLLRCDPVVDRSQPRPGRRIYDDAVREALVVVWEAADRICGVNRLGIGTLDRRPKGTPS